MVYIIYRHLQHARVGRVFGVVSQSPYYLVMELTINGDLKTFLLTAAQRAADHRLVYHVTQSHPSME